MSIKLLKKLKSKKIKTLQSDEYYKDKKNIDKNVLIKKSDIIIIATPHKAYKNLKIKKNKVLVDIWGLVQKILYEKKNFLSNRRHRFYWLQYK